jgi:hypothetical protein
MEGSLIAVTGLKSQSAIFRIQKKNEITKLIASLLTGHGIPVLTAKKK